mmetsp:Transcript_8636/g.12885  ORF Transcript_8636/g.12885 Transcript_8636/m.12885 type:complete len:528 (+) Transcript_8636:58-1641(+)
MSLFLWLLTAILVNVPISNSNSVHESLISSFNNSNARIGRRLQFENMFDTMGSLGGKKKNRDKDKHNRSNRQKKSSSSQLINNRLQLSAEAILTDAPRYHLWWTGPPEESNEQGSNRHFSRPTTWGARHNLTYGNNAIFTMAVVQGLGKDDTESFSSTVNNLLLYLHTARKVFDGDIVIALEAESGGLSEEVKAILRFYRAVVYELPTDLCSKATNSIFCGSADERVPASVFRFYFFELWASMYPENSLILITDFRDVFFQSNPFTYRTNHWHPEHQLVLFKEFHPNMVIGRCRFNRLQMEDCYGLEALRLLGQHVIVSSGAALGSRDAVLVWARHMTLQLQDAPGRQVEGRCQGAGIEHAFINWLVYGNKLRQLGVRIRLISQGEGAVNSVGGLLPNTVGSNALNSSITDNRVDPSKGSIRGGGTAGLVRKGEVVTISGPIQSFWRIFSDDGYVLNWNGEVSPVVHQLDHFQDELVMISDKLISSGMVPGYLNLSGSVPDKDRAWQAVAVARCLWGCKSSKRFGDT